MDLDIKIDTTKPSWFEPAIRYISNRTGLQYIGIILIGNKIIAANLSGFIQTALAKYTVV